MVLMVQKCIIHHNYFFSKKNIYDGSPLYKMSLNDGCKPLLFFYFSASLNCYLNYKTHCKSLNSPLLIFPN